MMKIERDVALYCCGITMVLVCSWSIGKWVFGKLWKCNNCSKEILQ